MKTNNRISFHLNGAPGVFRRFGSYLRSFALVVAAVTVLIVSSLASCVVYASDDVNTTTNETTVYAPAIFEPGYQLPETTQREWIERLGEYRFSLGSGLGTIIPCKKGEYFGIRWDHAAVWDYQTYDPDEPMTRIEFVYYLAKTLRLNRVAEAPLPADIDPNSSYANWWQRIQKTDIFQFLIDGNNQFYPNEPMTLAQICYAIGEYWKYTGAYEMLPGILNPEDRLYDIYVIDDQKEIVTYNQNHWSINNLRPVIFLSICPLPLLQERNDYTFEVCEMKDVDRILPKREVSGIFMVLFGRAAFESEKDPTFRPEVSSKGKSLFYNSETGQASNAVNYLTMGELYLTKPEDRAVSNYGAAYKQFDGWVTGFDQIWLLGPQWEVARVHLEPANQPYRTSFYKWQDGVPHVYYRDTGEEAPFISMDD